MANFNPKPIDCDNRKPRRQCGRSGFKGVYPAGNKWQVQIKFKGQRYILGTYPTPEEASEVYLAECANLKKPEYQVGFPHWQNIK